MIQEARKAAGLTQAELARKSKLDPANIANYETRIIPPLDKLDRIGKALKKRVTIEFQEVLTLRVQEPDERAKKRKR